VNSFIEILEKREVLVFERIKKFLIDCKNFVPFNTQKSLNSISVSTHDLAVIVQFLTYNENLVIGPSRFMSLVRNEKYILDSSTCVKKSAESPFYSSYIMEQDFIDKLEIPSEHFWIYKPYRSVNVDQRIVDLLVVGQKRLRVEKIWRNLVEEYEIKRAEMVLKVEGLHDVFEDLLNKNLALGGILRGSAGSNKRYPTENDVDLVILTPDQRVHSVIKSIMVKKVGGFKKLNWAEEESVILDPSEKYELEIDLISAKWLPLHPIMAKAQIDIIDNSTVLFGREAVKRYRDKLKEIMMRGAPLKRPGFSA
jgi:hypothetical protein